ncbi:HAD-IA family hydrolase [Vineibacter terrae]|uniref:HAD-IA family hydrolase n=1 Tax=Vineibacter terrae TaxID=2586908 RepID=A0A5C8PBX3_9HYPH|nr:HAD-IA family hydrolase [Vineibacter terrae]TXL71302.1 HAD-IA family hydrolase [Vineibacter terrae]
MLIIFDCDGVLVDTEPVSNRCFAAALNREGLAWDVPQTMRELMGRSLKSCVAIAEAALGRALPADFVDRLQAETFAAFRREGVNAIAGVAEAIDALEAAGHRTCVASSGDIGKMRITLGGAGLWDRFEGRIFSATQVARGKPFPDLFLLAAREMKAAPDACLVVEDAVAGTEAAVAAGMRVLCYAAAPYADRDGMAAAGGEVFADMRQLPLLVG